MPIYEVLEGNYLNVLGKIRLGVRDERTSNGRTYEFPSNVDYFVLDDAPDVKKFYGDNPKEIHGFFHLKDDELKVDPLRTLEEKAIPTWLRLYGSGSKDSRGNIIPGDLKCKGTGVYPNGDPGEAYDYTQRDELGKPITIACPGEKHCPKAVDAKGNRLCKWAMNIYIFMPHCNPTGVYQIDTTSKTTIFNFWTALRSTFNNLGGRIAGVPFLFYREEMYLKIPNTNQKKSHPILKIKAAPEFHDKLGNQVKKEIGDFLNSRIIIDEPYMEDNYPVLTSGKSDGLAIASESSLQPEIKVPPEEIATIVLADEGVKALFHELENLIGKQYTEKARKVAVLKKIAEPDVRQAVIDQLTSLIETTKSKLEKQKNPNPPKQIDVPAQVETISSPAKVEQSFEAPRNEMPSNVSNQPIGSRIASVGVDSHVTPYWVTGIPESVQNKEPSQPRADENFISQGDQNIPPEADEPPPIPAALDEGSIF